MLLQAFASSAAPDEDDPLLTLRTLRLTAAQVDRVRAELARAVEELEEAPPGEPRYGVLVALQRSDTTVLPRSSDT